MSRRQGGCEANDAAAAATAAVANGGSNGGSNGGPKGAAASCRWQTLNMCAGRGDAADAVERAVESPAPCAKVDGCGGALVQVASIVGPAMQHAAKKSPRHATRATSRRLLLVALMRVAPAPRRRWCIHWMGP